ncbi:MAG: helix-turn-helix transcriptional regulator [Tissierellia bacterium]|nr:helix-turn-helix transcriptional regulator [Tissierellia bacterium]
MKFHEVLKDLIHLSGLKYKDIAEQLRYDSSYISKWVNGKNLPNISNDPNLFRNLSKIISTEIIEKGKTSELKEMSVRNVPIDNINFAKLFVYSLLHDSYYATTQRENNLFAKSSDVVLGYYKIMETTFHLINLAVVNSVNSVDLYSNLNINKALGTNDVSLERFYSTLGVEINYHYMTYENIDSFDDRLLGLLDHWVIRSQFINNYIYRPLNRLQQYYIYIRNFVTIFVALDSNGKPIMMSYTFDKGIQSEMSSFIDQNFSTTNLIMGSRSGDTVESDVFSSSLVDGNEFLFHMSYLETFFISNELLEDLLKRRNVPPSRIESALWTQKLSRQLSTSLPLTLCYRRKALNHSFQNKEIVLGSYILHLSDGEMIRFITEYIEYVEKADNLRIFISPRDIFPHRHGSTSMSFIADRYNIMYKRNPRYTDKYIKDYIVASHNPATTRIYEMMKNRLLTSDSLEYSTEEFASLLKNHLNIYEKNKITLG